MAYGFPSPTGDLYFSIVPVLTSHAGLNPFPSPTGDLYFSIHASIRQNWRQRFPSPTGDLYFSIKPKAAQKFISHKFPSPTGDLYFSIEISLKNKSRQFSVSVPYRGLIFLNKLSLSVWIDNGSSFRPLPGTYISQYKNTGDVFASQSFPSPTGDLYFSI